ncbi:hypothetical protein TRFO_30728 [Tritrichomonas foetus]|uniref:Uncharacterized protein n=1 Tax=Tritrichomonas foetus TaxID=1144522 RepID=A0A1J4JXF8_9EUKA|nr:hypothetical protein TRFO_30728 [Tritrichomonas foetus]|eukprot:OHT02220.1 hypothetical protein TRFO_30728 [Tritrichomonas foetus]
MMKKPYKDLISLIPTQFYENALEFILNKFDEQVQEQHSNYKENFPTIFHEIRSYSSIKIKEGDIFEFLKMRGDSSGFIDDATNYYVSVVNQISHQQISKLDEHNFNQFDIQKFLNTNLNAIKDKANCIFQKYWESYVTNKSFENMIKQIAGQNKTFTIDEFSKRKELIFPTTVQAAREAGQQGSQVRLWKNNKFTKFTVNSNDQVYIPDISIKLKEHKYFITNGDYGFCHINYYDIVYDFDFNKMTLHVNLSAVITEKNHWSTYFWYRIPQRKHKNEHYVRELIIKIGGNFTFENGAQCITISSPSPPGGNGSYCGKTPVLKEFKLLAH